MRPLYLWVLRLHPARFRDRFLDEMLLSFDDASSTAERLELVIDALSSLFRQWIFRSRNWRPQSRRHSVLALDGGSHFAEIGETTLRPSSMAIGIVVTLMIFVAIPTFITYGHEVPASSALVPGVDFGLNSTPVNGPDWGVRGGIAIQFGTAADRQLREWLQIYNTGDPRTMNAFYRNHTANRLDDALDAERKVREWDRNFRNSGPLRIQEVIQYGRLTAAASCIDTKGNRWQVSITVDDKSHSARGGDVIAAIEMLNRSAPR